PGPSLPAPSPRGRRTAQRTAPARPSPAPAGAAPRRGEWSIRPLRSRVLPAGAGKCAGPCAAVCAAPSGPQSATDGSCPGRAPPSAPAGDGSAGTPMVPSFEVPCEPSYGSGAAPGDLADGPPFAKVQMSDRLNIDHLEHLLSSLTPKLLLEVRVMDWVLGVVPF